jgi:arginase
MTGAAVGQPTGTPTLLGIPFDEYSSFLRGSAAAPPLIRAAMASPHSNLWTEGGVDLGDEGVFDDRGDLSLASTATALESIEAAVGELVDQGRRPVCLGGDHAITYPIVKAIGQRVPGLTVVHFDAHPDLYPEFEGNRYSHACPFARIMEQRWAARLIQVGIRAETGVQREQAERFGVETLRMSDLPAYARLALTGPVYISFDLDALDPSCAPGVSHREPGGLSVREAIAHLHATGGTICGIDLVEYNPSQDHAGQTALVCAKLLKELLGLMV